MCALHYVCVCVHVCLCVCILINAHSENGGVLIKRSFNMCIKSNALLGRLCVNSLSGTGSAIVHFERLWSTGKGLKRITVKMRVLEIR